MAKQSPIERAIEIVGGLTALATLIDVSPQVIVNWRERGVPANRALAIEAATGAKVTRHELRPDIYPREQVA
jgi:DNA-binding transcriptional regulator YdaS (Cro superfamily)